MKTIILFTGIFLCLQACNTRNTKIEERVKDADSIAINYFKGDGSMDTVIAVKIIRDKKEINQLTDFIAGKNTAAGMKCGYDGSIHFFKQNSVLQDIDFRMNEADCMFFSFLQDGKPVATKLSVEAKAFLNQIKN